MPRTALVLGTLVLACFGQTPTWTALPPFPPIPNASGVLVADVEAVGPNDVWAVGQYQEPGPTPQAGPHVRNLVMRFDGQAWTQIPVPNPSTGGPTLAGRNYLLAIGAVSANDIWVAGAWEHTVNLLAFGFDLQLLHWDGSSWTHHQNPVLFQGAGGELSDIRVNSSNDVHFVGHGPVVPSNTGILLRWDGSGFVNGSVAAPGAPFCVSAAACSGTSASDVWAVGGSCFGGGSGAASFRYVCHFDGSAWSAAVPPAAGFTAWGYSEVLSIGPNDVWISGIGTALVGTVTTEFPLIQRWNGSSWSTIPAPNLGSFPVPFSLEAISPTEVYAALFGGVMVWNGSTWNQDLTFPTLPSVSGFTIVTELSRQGSDLYAVIAATTTGPRIARRGVPAVPAAAAGARPARNPAAAPGTLSALVLPVIGTSMIVGVDDPTNFGSFSPPATGAWWLISIGAGAGYPCGVGIWGAGLFGVPGEVLLDIMPGQYFGLGPHPWAGPGQPALFGAAIPGMPSLAGLRFYTQGILIDTTAAPYSVMLTNALDLTIGT
jgi:hypothetical protein